MTRARPIHLLAAAAAALAGLVLGPAEAGAGVQIDASPSIVVAGDDSAARIDVAYNAERNEFYAVWEETGTVVVPGSSNTSILGQRLSADGAPLGSPKVIAVGSSGGTGLASSFAPPKVAYNAVSDQYLVVYARAAFANGLAESVKRSLAIQGRLVSDQGVALGSEVALNPPLGNFFGCSTVQPEIIADPGTGGYVLAYGLRWGTTSTFVGWECGGVGPAQSRTIVQALDASLAQGARASFPSVHRSIAVTPRLAHNPVTDQIMVTQPFAFGHLGERRARSFQAQMYTSALTPVGGLLTVDVDPTDESGSGPVNRALPVADPETGNWFIASSGSVIGTVWTNLLAPSGSSLRPGVPLGTGGLNNVGALGNGRFMLSANGGSIVQVRGDGTVIHRQTSPIRGSNSTSQVAAVGSNGAGVGFGLFDGNIAAVGFTVAAPGVLTLTPARLLETRTNAGLSTVDGEALGDGQVQAGRFKVLEVAGRGGVPDDATAVNLNVTAVRASAAGFVTVYPCDAAERPNTSNLNYAQGGAASAAAFARLSDSGTVCVFTSATADLIVDVNGFVPAAGSVEPLVPARLLDTRPTGERTDGEAQAVGRVRAESVTVLSVAGRGGVASDADAVIVNVTAVRPSSNTFLTVYPCDEPRPTASNVNAAAAAVVNNLVLAKTSASGTICVFSSSATDLLVDVAAYVPAGGGLLSVVPARLLETRAGNTTTDGQGQSTSPVAAESVTRIGVAGRGGVADDAAGVVLNVAAIRPSQNGFIAAYPCDEDRPDASNVNFRAGAVVSNAVVVKLSSQGTVCLYSTASTNLAVDVVGYSVDS